MISERTLKRWRREALQFKGDILSMKDAAPSIELCERILKLTQELMDSHLMKKL